MDAAKKEKGTASCGPLGELFRQDPAKRLLALTERHPIDLAGVASRNPVGAVRSAAAAIDLDGVAGGWLAWIAVAGSGVLYPLRSVVALVAGNHVVGMTIGPLHRAGALDKFCERLPL